MKSRLVVFGVVVAAAVFLLGGVCSRKLYPPVFVSIPYSVYAGETFRVRLAASGSGYDSVRYVVNWDDGTNDTTGPVALTEAAIAWHVWTAAPDTRYVRAAVFPVEDPRIITWAEQRRVLVEAGGQHAPIVDSVLHPPVAIRGETTQFIIYAHDPDGDSMRVHVAWDTTETTTTAYFASPTDVNISHVFTQVETAEVVVKVQDRNGAVSLPDTIPVPVGHAGTPLAPWPNWRHDLYSSGHGGGRE